MLSWEAWMDIQHLRKEGHSIKAIARLTGRSRNTVSRALRQKVPVPFKLQNRDSQSTSLKVM